jgi:hypothetical protein
MGNQYERRDIGGAIAQLETTETAAGGQPIDLSELLPEERYFIDAYTHFTDEGVAIVSAATLRALAGMLGH